MSSNTIRSIAMGIGFAVVFHFTTGQASAQSATGAGGGWRGEWVSETNGHHGPLRAHVRALDNGDYRVRYAGRFAGIVPFIYPATMHRTGEGPCGEVYLSNSTRIPFFGTFHADAVLTNNSFDSQFTSKKESGRFTLRR